MGPEAVGRAVSCLDLGEGADLCHSCSGSDDGTDTVKRHRKRRKSRDMGSEEEGELEVKYNHGRLMGQGIFSRTPDAAVKELS